MDSFTDFMTAALPWIAMGLFLVVFFARAAHSKKGKEENYGSEGIELGLCFGVAMGTALHIDIGLGMMAGMVLGLLIGSGIKKDE